MNTKDLDTLEKLAANLLDGNMEPFNAKEGAKYACPWLNWRKKNNQQLAAH